MKKILKFFVLAIALVAALGSCSNELKENPTLASTVIKAYFDETLSKTALNSDYQVVWSADDAISAFDIEGTQYTSTSTTVSQDGLVAEFAFNTSEDLYYAIFPADKTASMNNDCVITTTLPLVQNAVAGGFDSKANLAISQNVDNTAKFLNGGTLIGFEIKNDDIKKIEFESNLNLAGPCYISIDSKDEPLLQSTYAESTNKVTLQGNFEKGNTYYAVVFPTDYSGLKITFTREDGKTATYTNTASLELSALRNAAMTVFAKEIPDSKWQGGEPSEDCFVKVTSAPTDWTGEYLIVSEDFGIALNGNVSASNLQKAANMIAVAPHDGKIAFTQDLLDATVVVEAYQSGYSLKTKGADYIGHTTTSNTGFSGSQSPILNNISWNDGAVVITTKYSDVTYTIAANPNPSKGVNYPMINFYKTIADTYKPIYLYKKGSVGPVVTKYDVSCATVEGGTISADPVKAAEGTTVTLTATPLAGYAFESWNVTGATVADATSATTTFTMPAANVNVSATFKEKESEALTTMDEIFAKATEVGSTKTDVKVGFTNCVVTGVAGSNVYVVDANGTKGLIIYQANHGFEVGDKLNGEVNCQVYLYNGSSDLVGVTSKSSGLTVTKDGVVAPQTISIADLSGVNTGAVLSFAELTYNGTVFSDGTNTITPYKTFITLPTLVSGKKYSVTGVYIQFKDTKEIAPRTAEDIVEKAATKYAVSVATVANGSLSVDYSQATEGQTVTITATPASGYKLKAGSVKVTKASSGTVTVTNDKTFTMPAEAVTVSAEFEVDASGETTVTWVAADASDNPGDANEWLSGAIDSNISWSATKGGSNNPKYYSNGSGLRVYNGGTFTVSAANSKKITKVVLTFSGTGHTFSTSNTNQFQTYELDSVTSKEWSVSRTCRLQKVEVTYK